MSCYAGYTAQKCSFQDHSKRLCANTELNQAGFSEPILQPCYLIGIGLIFIITPIFGMFISFLLVFIPSMYVASKIASKHPHVNNGFNGNLVTQGEYSKERKIENYSAEEHEIENISIPLLHTDTGAEVQPVLFVSVRV